MRRARRGASLGMMFDTLAENMSSVANLFTGQKTITESRCGLPSFLLLLLVFYV